MKSAAPKEETTMPTARIMKYPGSTGNMPTGNYCHLLKSSYISAKTTRISDVDYGSGASLSKEWGLKISYGSFRKAWKCPKKTGVMTLQNRLPYFLMDKGSGPQGQRVSALPTIVSTLPLMHTMSPLS